MTIHVEDLKFQCILGILDFERTEVSSIDFNLDIVKRMVDYPKKYISEKFKKFANVWIKY